MKLDFVTHSQPRDIGSESDCMQKRRSAAITGPAVDVLKAPSAPVSVPQKVPTEPAVAALPHARTFIALGQIAHQSAVKILGGKLPKARFAHLAEHRMPDGRVLIDSYHCSRYNQNTGRLTAEMFDAVFARAVAVAATRSWPGS